MENRFNLDLEELQKVAGNIARKYSRNTKMEAEDMAQELMMCVWEKQMDNMAMATTIMKNKAIDLSRADWRRNNGVYSVDYENPAQEIFVVSNLTHKDNNDEGYENIRIQEMLDILPARERRYVVAKTYLTEGLDCLKSEFDSIFESLSSEDQNVILSSDRKITEDTILKIFMKIKTGSNSGTIRGMKTNIRNLLASEA